MEEAIVAADAALSAIIMLYMLGTGPAELILVAVLYLGILATESLLIDTTIAVIVTIAWALGILHPLSTAFLLGVFVHHRIHGTKMHWADPAVHDAVSLYILFAIAGAAAMQPAGTGTWLLFLAIAIISIIQNFVSLVLIAPLFGVPPSIGTHMFARSFGPSETAILAAVLVHKPDLALAALSFYALATFVYSFVRTEADAERLVSVVLPRRLIKTIEAIERTYAAIYVRHSAILSEAYVEKMRSTTAKTFSAWILAAATIIAMMDILFINHVSHGVLYIFTGVTLLAIALWALVGGLFAAYSETIEFLSEHAYNGRLRPGHAPAYFVAGYIVTVLSFYAIPFTIPTLNLVLLFFALIALNLGLYLLLSNYYKIMQEFLAKRTA